MKPLILAFSAVALAAGAIQPANAGPSASYAHITPVIASSTAEHVVQASYGYRVPLKRVLHKLYKRGFWGVKNVRWFRDAYVVTAHGYRGHLVRVTVNAYTGDIVDIDRIHKRKRNFYGRFGWMY